MSILPFIKGVIIGFAIAVPVGAVAIICIRKALADDRIAAFVAGLGAACADTFYGAVAALGLGLVSEFLDSHKVWLATSGGLFLVFIGLRCLYRPPVFSPEAKSGSGYVRDFLSTFFITLTNPVTVVAFMALFATFSVTVDPKTDAFGATELILGVFTGAASWWFILAFGASLVRAHFTPHWLLWLNRVSGAGLIALGVSALVYGLMIHFNLLHLLGNSALAVLLQ
ncbi:LysE family transporter [Phaeovibrio sulfidiphilus]|uniref:LysE family transporter n=1 Tax=Phaeovibrio sulfidiphilus TaxID=1220600 RepID=A0A8J6YY37_9PROT|nr:LysE family transporter [Phaeovibrio sulfidiphilus]MBE1237812.1 LysE family transporter [Phaeovibrio sulfidiphilus]